MNSNLIVFFGAWLIGTVLLFGHEVWLWWKHPLYWKDRQKHNVIPDWQVWLVMLFWPFVFMLAGVVQVLVYISTNVSVWFASRRARKRKV